MVEHVRTLALANTTCSSDDLVGLYVAIRDVSGDTAATVMSNLLRRQLLLTHLRTHGLVGNAENGHNVAVLGLGDELCKGTDITK